jgi:hypothetical protein
MAPRCAAGAHLVDPSDCDGDPYGLVLRYEPTDFGGTMGCPRHVALLQAEHPGSLIVSAEESLRTMRTFSEHPDFIDLDEHLDHPGEGPATP